MHFKRKMMREVGTCLVTPVTLQSAPVGRFDKKTLRSLFRPFSAVTSVELSR